MNCWTRQPPSPAARLFPVRTLSQGYSQILFQRDFKVGGLPLLRRTFLWASMGNIAAAGCARAQPQQTSLSTIPLDLSGPRPTAELRIGDAAPVRAIFDTGAAGSVLKLAYAQRIGVPNQGPAAASAPGGTPIHGYRTTIDGRLGDAPFVHAMAVALEIPLPLEGVDAIISPSVFAGRLVRFDFARNVAQVLAKTAANMPPGTGTPYFEDARGGHHITSIPAVELTLPGQAPIVALADTGASRGLVLPLRIAASLPLATPLASADPVRMVGVTFAAQTARLGGAVRVGAIEFRDLEVTFVDGETPANVGFSMLQRTVLVLDPGEHRSWLLAGNSGTAQ